jgi:hypothetical protein
VKFKEQLSISNDYVLPIGKGSQFEAGYKGNFNNLNKAYDIFSDDNGNNVGNLLSKYIRYKEKN